MILNIYKSEKSKSGSVKVRLSIKPNFGKRVITQVGTLKEGEFAQLEKKVKNGKGKLTDAGQVVYNLYRKIDAELTKIEQGVAIGLIQAEDVDVLEVVNKCKGKEKKKQPGLGVYGLFLQYIKECSKSSSWSDGTITQAQKAMRIVSSYCNDLDELSTKEGVEGYEKYLIAQGTSNNTIKQYLGVMLTFLRWCHGCGYCGNDYDRYKCRLKTADSKEKAVVFLSVEEIAKVAGLELTNVRKAVRDVFLFQCYTGLRWSDVMGLCWSDVKEDTIKVSVKKTATYLQNKIPIQAIAILEEYRGKKYAHNKVFPQYNNSTYNEHLKLIAKDAGLCDQVIVTEYRNGKRETRQVEKWEKMTTHVGRKTFVVNCLSNGFTANQVIKVTGHSSVQALQPYIDITEGVTQDIADMWSKIADK